MGFYEIAFPRYASFCPAFLSSSILSARRWGKGLGPTKWEAIGKISPMFGSALGYRGRHTPKRKKQPTWSIS